MKKVLGIGIILSIMLVGCNNEELPSPVEDADASTEVVEEEPEVEEVAVEESVELTPQEQMFADVISLIEEGKAFDAGSYIKGDIPKGEYAFVTFDQSGQYYSEEDPAGNIVDNENFDSFGYVEVHESGNIQTRGALVKIDALSELNVSGAKELYEVLNNTEEYKDAGWYKVGVDIEPGEYVIESYGDGYVAIMAGPVGSGEIIDNENFNGRYSVNVTEGQYLVISRGAITE